MDKKKLVPTEMGSARFVSLDGDGSTNKYEADSTTMQEEFSGPPWGIEPSINFLCDEVGIDYHSFISGLATNKNDMEMAQEFGVNQRTITDLKEYFYKTEAITGNYGQD